MRRLFLIRHAKAQPAASQNDYHRALTGRGRADAQRMARALAVRHLSPEVVIHSGALRAKRTAEIFADEWAGEVELLEDGALYDATESALFARARALPNARAHVAFVGHNPGLGELAAALAGSGAQSELRRMAAKFPTCAVAVLDFSVGQWTDIARHSGSLALFLTPSELDAETG